jgi:hypothetical protein
MKIALVRREALDVPDGINIFLFSLADALIAAGHEVVMVATFSHDMSKIQEYYKLEHWPETVALTSDNQVRYSRALFTWMRAGRSTMAALNPDFVLINGAVPLSLPGLTCTVSHDAEQRLGRVPMLRNLFKRYSYRQSDMVCATCDEVRDALASEASIDRANIAVIPTCVKLDAAHGHGGLQESGRVDSRVPACRVQRSEVVHHR